jgi:hypothetical protein
LKFVETSDVHGCYFPYDFIQNKQMRGSLAREARREYKGFLEYKVHLGLRGLMALTD